MIRLLIATLLLVVYMASAQDDFENFRIELTASAWLVNPSGTIQSGVTPIDLRSDLQLEQSQPHFCGKLVLKPGRRHRIIVEGIPYRLSGGASISRQIVFAGRTYNVQDFVTSTADIDYIAGAYQFDAISRARGHLGLLAGVGYVDATGVLASRNFGFRGAEHQSFPIPQVGAEGRAFLLPHRRLLEVDGELKGMPLGGYGHYLQFAIHGGVTAGRHLTIQAGYMLADADVHRQDRTRGFQPRFQGPVFGIQLRDR